MKLFCTLIVVVAKWLWPYTIFCQSSEWHTKKRVNFTLCESYINRPYFKMCSCLKTTFSFLLKEPHSCFSSCNMWWCMQRGAVAQGSFWAAGVTCCFDLVTWVRGSEGHSLFPNKGQFCWRPSCLLPTQHTAGFNVVESFWNTALNA